MCLCVCVLVVCLCMNVKAASRLWPINRCAPFPVVTQGGKKTCEKEQGGKFLWRYTIARHERRHDLRGKERNL